MSKSHRITLLGAGFIGNFYTTTLHAQRRRDRTMARTMDIAHRGRRTHP